MDDIIDKTQRWFAITARSFFLNGSAIHLSDSPNPADWARLYRWHVIKQLSAPILMVGVGLSMVAVVLLMPGSEILFASLVKPATVVLATVSLVAGILLMVGAKRKPFSVITIPLELPFSLGAEIADLWPHLDAEGREHLRKDLIRTFESQKEWSPQALQQALTSRVERHRTRALGAEAGSGD